jgi:PAS domain-containing protein
MRPSTTASSKPIASSSATPGWSTSWGKNARDLVPDPRTALVSLLRRCRAQPALGAHDAAAESLGRWYEVHAFRSGRRTAIASRCSSRTSPCAPRAEVALRDSEERFRCLANASPSILWSATSDGAMTWLSDRWTEYTGQGLDVSREERNSLIHPTDR